MAAVSDEDWTLLNAYADGELPPAERARVARRLVREPALAAALAEVHRAKAGLSLLRPAPGEPAETRHGARTAGRVRRMALAAAVVLMMGGLAAGYGIVELVPGTPGGDPVALHRALSQNTYVLSDALSAVTVSTGGMGSLSAPDLSDSRLSLVEVKNAEWAGHAVVAMHYRGVNGCRLSIVAVDRRAPPSDAATDGLLTARWHAGAVRFNVIADGMDPDRFAAIAALVEAETTRTRNREAYRVALGRATEQARPCA